ncbi:DUF2865 domain-containing protein [Pararhizobium antarcticum]|uniref:DUF2865 domain-containing protein n=1 Tax=Pararhizobium antarcticum TaxID=1798805 RepID=A0A657LQB3_9HYPH|nr:DUF2865 domain-containing protein [Pararhizobium antarcticum]OJF93960.1 hypothetical protein AX761_19360 [Rhizobium sp. 58]OJF94072.1 hypothetical protein AX760_20755 [Pararhizobium antarcticum]
MQEFAKQAGKVFRLPVMVVAVALSLAVPAVAGAGNCSATPVASSAGRSTEAASLRRQIKANQALGDKYGCTLGKSSLACREISGRISQAGQRLAKISGRTALAARCARPAGEAKMFATAVKQPRAEQPEKSRSIRAQANPMHRATSVQSASMETMCVRLSDGYYFPSPNSGYGRSRDTDKIVVQCQFICEDAEMDVFRMAGAERVADDMVSLTTGKRYADLPGAGAYRVAVPVRTCDMARYYKTVLARSPVNEAVDLGVSADNPVVPVPMLAMNMSLMSDVGLRGSRSLVTDRPRKVRIVGPSFLPMQD